MMKEYPTVSVIIPIYCVEKYLEKCVASVIGQTYSQLEIILVDDGSPDESGYICDKSAEIDSRIFVLHKENGGLSSARNAGLDIATGEYIAFVDADDTIHPQFIEILIGLCLQYDCDIAQCDFLAITESSVKLPLNASRNLTILDNQQVIHELCCGNSSVRYVVIWNKIYKRKLFDDIRFPIGRIHEDEFVTYLLLWNCKKIIITNQYLYYYLQRKDSITRDKFSLRRLDILEALRNRADFLKKQSLEKEYFNTLRALVYTINKICRLLEMYIEDNEKIINPLLEEKEKIEKLLPVDIGKRIKLNYIRDIESQICNDCLAFVDSRIVLYGAGSWGRRYYSWIKNNYPSIIVGWVDNLWYGISNTEYKVEPLDSIFNVTFDYILIAIRNKVIQEEVRDNLISWGVSESKIYSISTDNL